MQTVTRPARALVVLALAIAAGVPALAPPAFAAEQLPPAPASPAAAEPKPSGLVLEGDAAEAFLRTAPVVERSDLGTGITRSQRLTLRDGTRSVRAVWKTIDVHTLGQQRMEQGWEFDFRDSWRSEVAAYELDNRAGSLQLWVEQAMTEDERRRRRIDPPHVARWNNQLHNVRLLHQLEYNTDFQNVRNLLIDPAFRVYAIDNSRAFRIQRTLLAPNDLVCFSRSVLERLRALDLPSLQEHLGRWLDKTQLEGLLARRAAILAIAEKRVTEKGEGAVLFY